MDEILVFALYEVQKACKFSASAAKGCSWESNCARLPLLTVLLHTVQKVAVVVGCQKEPPYVRKI